MKLTNFFRLLEEEKYLRLNKTVGLDRICNNGEQLPHNLSKSYFSRAEPYRLINGIIESHKNRELFRSSHNDIRIPP